MPFAEDFVKEVLETADGNTTCLYTIGGLYQIEIKSIEMFSHNVIIIEEAKEPRFIPIVGIPYILCHKGVLYLMHFTEVIIGNKMHYILDGKQNANLRNNQDSKPKGDPIGIPEKEISG